MASGIDATPDLFGWQFRRKPNKSETELINPQVTDDGAVMVAAGGVFGSYIDLSGVSPRAEADLISRYREMEVHPIVYNAVSEISNEAISTDEEGDVVNIDLDNLEDELNESLRKRISEEFDRVLDVLDFRNKSYDIFHRWYVDGRLNYHVAIDPKNKSKGISALAQVDPRKVKKVREVEKKRVKGSSAVSGAEITRVKKEYFVYNDNGFVSRSTQGAQASPSGTIGIETAGIKISSDAMVYVTSGLTDPSGNMVVSYLHKAIRYLNEMRMLEDASVIYRLSRAPERRVWYIDTTGMPRVKAEQHVKDVMTRNKNQVVFDPSTGQVRDGRKFMTLTEDFWIPRSNGSKGTEVTQLQGGQNLGEMEDVEYFKRQVYDSLHVPVDRLQSSNVFTSSQSNVISRDEVRFSKFIGRLRNKFSQLFVELLGRQLALVGVMAPEDWDEIKNRVVFKYSKDNQFLEIKNQEVISGRMETLAALMNAAVIGKYVSHETVRKTVLMQTDEEIERENERIAKELQDPILNPPVDENGVPVSPDQIEASSSQKDDDGEPEDGEKIARAQQTYEHLQPKKNKTKQEQSEFKSAAQILAKN